MKRLSGLVAGAGAAVLMGLTACGGGDGTEDTLARKPNCPAVEIDDIWVNRRLGCTSAGAGFVGMTRDSKGAPVDRAFVIAQQSFDRNSVLLLDGKTRFFKRFLCIKNLPSDANLTNVAGDLQFTMELSNFSVFRPRNAGATVLLVYDGAGNVPYQDMACDPAVHPVIVNYATGAVESVNPAALANIEISDRY